MQILLTGWSSFVHGAATAGDVLSMDRVRHTLEVAGLPVDVAWSPVLRPGALHVDDADPEQYTHLVFACGPVHGAQISWLHSRFRRCRRIAVGVTVIDPADPAVTGFDHVLARDGAAADRANLPTTELGHWWQWCLSPQGRAAAAERAAMAATDEELVSELLQTLEGAR